MEQIKKKDKTNIKFMKKLGRISKFFLTNGDIRDTIEFVIVKCM